MYFTVAPPLATVRLPTGGLALPQPALARTSAAPPSGDASEEPASGPASGAGAPSAPASTAPPVPVSGAPPVPVPPVPDVPPVGGPLPPVAGAPSGGRGEFPVEDAQARRRVARQARRAVVMARE